MKYSSTDIALMKSDIEDENVPDKESEIRPWIYRGKTHTADGVGGASGNGGGDDNDEDDDEEEYREDVLSDWNLRK